MTIRHLPGMALILGGFVLVLGTVSASGQVLLPRVDAPESIAISTDQPLVFGSLTTTAGGTVTVSTTGTVTPVGVIPLGIGASPARFTLRFDNGNPHYNITLPASTTLRASNGATMLVDAFQSDPAGRGRVAPPARVGTLTVGATLHVAANQAPGDYSGTFDVIVNLGN